MFIFSVTRLGEILLFGYFLLEHFWHFLQNKQFQNMVCFTYFNIKKQMGVAFLDLQFELWYFGYSFGYISKYWANFSTIFWSLCLGHLGNWVFLPVFGGLYYKSFTIVIYDHNDSSQYCKTMITIVSCAPNFALD